MTSQDEVVSPTRALAASVVPLLRQHWAALLVVGLLVRLLAKRYLSPLRRYPGPVLASMTRLPRLLSVLGGRTQHDRIALHRRYGPLVRTAPDELSVASPALAREVLRAGKGFRKTDFYAVFPPPENPDVFTETREEKHALLKRVAGGPYSMASMRRLSAFIDDTIDELAGRLAGFCAAEESGGGGGGGGPPGPSRGAAGNPPSVDLGAWLHYFAFDVLGEVAFSRSFGFLAAGHDKEGAIAAIDASQRYNGVVGQVPELDRFLRRNPLCRLVPSLDPGNSLITRIAREEMAKRQPFAARMEKQAMEADGGGEVGDGRRDLLDSLIQGHLKPGSGFSEMDVFSVAHGAIFAGSDSTASTMQSFFWLVLSHPRVHERLVAELEAAVAAGEVPAGGNVDWGEAQGLAYLQACLREAMRLRPAVGLDMTRVVPAGGAALDAATRLPGGARVALNGWVLHRDAAVFGADADAFRPERWLEDADRARAMDKFLFQFGGGSHLCIGRNLALLEINKVIPRLLRDFRFRLVHPHRELRAKATFFVVQDGLDVYIERKNPAGAA